MLAIRRRACSVSSERHIRELGVRYLRALNRGQGSARPALLAFASSKVLISQCLARGGFSPRFEYFTRPASFATRSTRIIFPVAIMP